MLRFLVRRGLRKGLGEGSRPWLAVGLTATAVTVLRRVFENRPETVFRERISAGETWIVRAVGPEDEAVP